MENLILCLMMLLTSNYFFIKSESVILFPLKVDEISDDKNFEISKLETSKIYTEINIGNPNQKVKLYLSFNFYLTYIFNEQSNGYYNPLISSTYKNISKSTYYSSPFEKGFESNETFYMGTYNNSILEIKNYSFDLITNIKENFDTKSGILGLKLFDNTYRGDPVRNIIVQLKKRHFIESYGWSINFKNKREGVLGIGAYPHEYDKENYSTEFFKQILSGWRPTGVFWEIEFTNIITGYGNYIEKTRKCEMQIETGLIFGTEEYFDLVKKEFFEEKISQNECFLDTSTSTYYLNFKYFYCSNIDTVKQFKGIHFKNNDLDKDFFFNYNDLFLKRNNKYYFLIAFRPSSNVNWIIGYPFFKKYEFVFQPDKKLIGTYISYPKAKDEKNNNDKDNTNDNHTSVIILSCFVGIFAITIIILLVFLFKKFSKNFKKKRANELDDNFDYTSPPEENKLFNNE